MDRLEIAHFRGNVVMFINVCQWHILRWSKLCASNFILESKCLSEVIAKVYSVACA